jgi:hypothetical protein
MGTKRPCDDTAAGAGVVTRAAHTRVQRLGCSGSRRGVS